MCKLWWGSPGK
nr:unnamed protein product [Callosobruchus chinensis]